MLERRRNVIERRILKEFMCLFKPSMFRTYIKLNSRDSTNSRKRRDRADMRLQWITDRRKWNWLVENEWRCVQFKVSPCLNLRENKVTNIHTFTCGRYCTLEKNKKNICAHVVWRSWQKIRQLKILTSSVDTASYPAFSFLFLHASWIISEKAFHFISHLVLVKSKKQKQNEAPISPYPCFLSFRG